MKLDATDRRIIEATQQGLPLVPAPYAELAENLGMSEQSLLDRLARMKAAGVVRRIAAAHNHDGLGRVADGMTDGDIEDAHVAELGAVIGALPFVTHCYERPRARPDWPYNLFAMVHGSDRAEVEAKRAQIADLLGAACRGGDVLYSTRILKKTGLRLRERKA